MNLLKVNDIKVLVACEFSGRVREAFKRHSFDAWSCDLLPTEIPGQHIQGDVLKILNNGWDLMIAHPPCTYLSYAGKGHWNDTGRAELRDNAMIFFLELYHADIPHVVVENPKGWPMAAFRPADQRVEPFMFGDPERKRTYLWLRNLPLLNPTNALWNIGAPVTEKTGKRRWFTDRGSSDKKYRSRTFPGIAEAMADQWGQYLLKARE